MPKFITIGYGDQSGYERTDPAVKNDAHLHDEMLRRKGAIMGVAGEPVQVRNAGAKGVTTTTGSFMTSPLPVAGFAIVEAASLEQAIELVSRSPCAVANGVVEVWPLAEPS